MSKSKAKSPELRSRYQFGSLYVTYIPINDLTQLLNDSGKLSRFKSKASNPDAVDIFKNFLDNNPPGPINEGIAFIQLDLIHNKAGLKRISDRDGVIHTIAWSESDVQGIAELCDAYFNRLSQYEETHESIRSGQAPVIQAFRDISQLKEDPFLTNARVASLLGNFKVLIDNKPDELEALKSADLVTYDAINTIKTEYDAYLTKQRYEQPLAHLWSKEREILDSIEGINTVKLNIHTLLLEKGLRDDLENSASVFENLGFLSGLQGSNTEELLQVNQRLRFIPSKDRFKFDARTRLDFGSTTSKTSGGGFSGSGGSKGPLG